jgi:hypothetical protein
MLLITELSSMLQLHLPVAIYLSCTPNTVASMWLWPSWLLVLAHHLPLLSQPLSLLWIAIFAFWNPKVWIDIGTRCLLIRQLLHYLLYLHVTLDDTKQVCQVRTPSAECCSKSKFPHEGNPGLILNSRGTVKKAPLILFPATCKTISCSCVPNSTEWLSSTRCECK